MMRDRNERSWRDLNTAARQNRSALSHPDFTVGSGISPDLHSERNSSEARGLFMLNEITAGGEFHPALRTSITRYYAYLVICQLS